MHNNIHRALPSLVKASSLSSSSQKQGGPRVGLIQSRKILNLQGSSDIWTKTIKKAMVSITSDGVELNNLETSYLYNQRNKPKQQWRAVKKKINNLKIYQYFKFAP